MSTSRNTPKILTKYSPSSSAKYVLAPPAHPTLPELLIVTRSSYLQKMRNLSSITSLSNNIGNIKSFTKSAFAYPMRRNSNYQHTSAITANNSHPPPTAAPKASTSATNVALSSTSLR
jgi:hypothetical protein